MSDVQQDWKNYKETLANAFLLPVPMAVSLPEKSPVHVGDSRAELEGSRAPLQ